MTMIFNGLLEVGTFVASLCGFLLFIYLLAWAVVFLYGLIGGKDLG